MISIDISSAIRYTVGMRIKFDFVPDERDGNPQMIYFIRDECRCAFDIRTFTHNIAEIYLIIGGTGNSFIESKTYPFERNDFYIVNPYLEHSEFLRKDQSFDYYIIGAKNFFLPSTEESNPAVPRRFAANSPIPFLFNRIFQELSEKKLKSEEAANYYFRLLIVEIERAYKQRIAPLESKYSSVVGEAKKFIDERSFGNISPYAVSDHFGCVHNTLTKKFKKEVGCSIQEYILRKRIEEARTTLLTNTESISKIASKVGFDNPSYFSRYFKKIVGCSPTEYKKNSGKERNP